MTLGSIAASVRALRRTAALETRVLKQQGNAQDILSHLLDRGLREEPQKLPEPQDHRSKDDHLIAPGQKAQEQREMMTLLQGQLEKAKQVSTAEPQEERISWEKAVDEAREIYLKAMERPPSNKASNIMGWPVGTVFRMFWGDLPEIFGYIIVNDQTVWKIMKGQTKVLDTNGHPINFNGNRLEFLGSINQKIDLPEPPCPKP